VILATAMDQTDEICLAVDIGTTGEMALGSRKRILACSAPAARLRRGRDPPWDAGGGRAIDRVRIQEDVRLWTIGDVPPRAFADSGLIDALDQMLRRGLVDPGGDSSPTRDCRKGPRKVLEASRRAGSPWEFVPLVGGRGLSHPERRPTAPAAKGTILCGRCASSMESSASDPVRVSTVSLAGVPGITWTSEARLGSACCHPRFHVDRIQGSATRRGRDPG